MKKKYIYVFLTLVSVSSFLLPSVALAYGVCDNETGKMETFKSVICLVSDYIFYIIPVLISIALIIFLAGVVKYIAYGGNDEKRAEGAKFMMYGIIGLAVMVSVWGLVRIVTGTFGWNGVIPNLNQIKG